MATGKRIIATIDVVDGKEPKIQISDPHYKVIESREGNICIVMDKSEEYMEVRDEI